MSFSASIATCFKKYGVFKGWASRSEFWYFTLFTAVLLLPAVVLGPFGALLVLGVALPAWTVAARRLHDIDKSAWNILWYFVPGIGLILLLIWNTRKGTDGANRFGLDPFAPPIASPTVAAAPANSVASKTEQLTKLRALLEAGTVTQAEFDRMKTDLIGG